MHDHCAPSSGLDECLRGNYGRLPVLALKFAIILSALDWIPHDQLTAPVVELRHWLRAQTIAERNRESLHRLRLELARTEENRHEDLIIEYLSRQHDKPPTMRDIYRNTHTKRHDCADALQALIADGDVIEVNRRGKGESATIGYVLNQHAD
jgi:hypothetical protein